MNNFWEYMFDVVNSIKTDKVSERLTKAGFTIEIDQDEDDTGSFEQKSLIRTESNFDTILLAYHRDNSTSVELKYFTDDYDISDMVFNITKKSISVTIGDTTHKNINKTDYFNMTISYSGNSIVDFDIIKELQKHVEVFEGMVILYAPNEERDYGYV